jgi:hypothetical protein
MAKKPFRPPPGEAPVRQSAQLNRVLCDLQSPDAGTRAEAVRSLCPCRSAWDVPMQRYVAAMRDDPSSSVRHEVHHVLDEDSRWGARLENRRVKAELDAEEWDGDEPTTRSFGRRRLPRPRTKGASARMAMKPYGQR